MPIQNSPHFRGRVRACALVLDFFQSREDLLKRPLHRHTRAMRANDHRIARSPLSVARRPHAANDDLIATLPEQDMLEGGKALRFIQLLPCAGIDLPTDALDVKTRFDVHQAFAFQTQIFNVVIPTGMLPESREKDLAAGRRAHLPHIFRQELSVEVAHDHNGPHHLLTSGSGAGKSSLSVISPAASLLPVGIRTNQALFVRAACGSEKSNLTAPHWPGT